MLNDILGFVSAGAGRHVVWSLLGRMFVVSPFVFYKRPRVSVRYAVHVFVGFQGVGGFVVLP